MDFRLDIFGQQGNMGVYTQICFIFGMASESSPQHAIEILTAGLERLSLTFPWLAGQVVSTGAVGDHTGVFSIHELEKNSRLVIKDHRSDSNVPSVEKLRKAGFPIRLLDEGLIAPRTTIPTSADTGKPIEVFLLQANIIREGLLLTIMSQHQTMDMVGQEHIMYLLSKACRQEPYTSEQIAAGNKKRDDIIPLSKELRESGFDLSHQLQPLNSATATSSREPPPKCIWANFTFSNPSITTLKSLATKTVSSGFISTDDALSAYLWQAVSRARLSRLPSDRRVTFGRAINVRPHLGLSPNYPGLATNMVYSCLTLQTIVTSSVGSIASKLRLAVDPKTSNVGQDTRAYATILDRSPNKNVLSVLASLDLSADLTISSWAKVDCWSLDFNLGLGKPIAVKRPQFAPVESLGYFLPRTPSGEITLAICLRGEDMEPLKADKDFSRFARYDG